MSTCPRLAARSCGCLLFAISYLFGGAAQADSQAQVPAPLEPRTPTGFSTIAQDYVYAPPDEGSFSFPLRLGGGAPGELSIQEPSMCRGSAAARVDYSKARNTVRLRVKLDGLPYRMDAAMQDMSHQWNQFPTEVQDGKWQVWFVGELFSKESIFWYDGESGELIGNEYDVDVETLPPAAIPVPIPVIQMVCITPLFESDPRTLKARVDVTVKYDQILDAIGTGGVLVAYVPKRLCAPDEVVTYYTSDGLDPAEAMTFDDVLASIHSGRGMALATSLEPDPKPDYLRARDTPMIGWSGGYPQSAPEGIKVNPLTGEMRVDDSCATRQLDFWPAATYNFCPGN